MYKTFKIILLIFVGFFYLHPLAISSENKIKIGLLVPITGDDKELGEQIIKSTRIALKDINTEKIEIKDITEEWAVFSLMGPLSRKVLSKITTSDLQNEVFPFGTCRNIEINGHSVLALRITYSIPAIAESDLLEFTI